MEPHLDAAAVRRWADLAVAALEGARERIDAANVFPVADSDTGTNMLLTLAAARRAVDDAEDDAVGALHDLARGALLAARGNSGIILSELLRGLAVGAERAVVAARSGAGSDGRSGARGLALALRTGADAARAAVARPAPGTMLTAADAAADAAERAVAAGAGTADAATEAVAGARLAVLGSPDELDVLAHHGVLDAGAFGLTLVLAALRDALAVPGEGRASADLPGVDLPEDLAAASGRRPTDVPHPGHGVTAGEPDGAFEVMYVVEADADGGDLADGLRARLRAVGESVVVVGGDGVWQAHVHTDAPSDALGAAEGAGLRQVCVRSLLVPPGDVGVVAGVRSPGLLADAAGTGAVVLARTDRPWTPSELVRVLEDTGRDRIVTVLRSDSVATLRRSLHRMPGVSVEAVVVPDDLHVVAALTAREESLGRHGDEDRALEDMRAAVASLRWCDLDVRTDDVTAGLASLGEAGDVGLAMVLVGGDVPQETLMTCRTHLGSTLGLDVTELFSGRHDAVLRVGLL
ncbi:DAK2 domain-containing protein [Sanguibacter sp. HDW7]|uniref:DAK2 domain-containing protein n=1 Tax=Sanguibacter sp. HDW7 TaxID=2714931 RepID=UPI00140A45D9|nr:DAK2 domain-containing protein [Sanguibacter sp. HDW7]QIK83901.1 DAK2 domain-containing protein [Sanguibacter sp. HDW7]